MQFLIFLENIGTLSDSSDILLIFERITLFTGIDIKSTHKFQTYLRHLEIPQILKT